MNSTSSVAVSVRVNEENLARPQNEKGKARMRMNGRKRKAENYVNERKTLSRLEVDLVVNAEDALTKKNFIYSRFGVVSLLADTLPGRRRRISTAKSFLEQKLVLSEIGSCWTFVLRYKLCKRPAHNSRRQTPSASKLKFFFFARKTFFLVSGMRWGWEAGETRKTEQ